MSKNLLPTAVPLPEVSDYTDTIVFGSLDMPLRFDEAQLLVNLRAIERFRSIAGLGGLSIVGERAGASGQSIEVNGVDAFGRATASSRSSTSSTNLSNDQLGPTGFTNTSFGRADATVRINTDEIDAKLQSDERYPRRHYDAAGRAKYLDSALKHGLRGASLHANFDRDKLLYSGRYYGMYTGIIAATGGNLEKGGAYMFLCGPLLQILSIARGSWVNNTH